MCVRERERETETDRERERERETERERESLFVSFSYVRLTFGGVTDCWNYMLPGRGRAYATMREKAQTDQARRFSK
jgi:hypothetical protein